MARVKGIPDNTFFVNFFCVYMEKTLISFFSFSLSFYFCLFEISFERIYLFLKVNFHSKKQPSFYFDIDILSWQETSLFSS